MPKAGQILLPVEVLVSRVHFVDAVIAADIDLPQRIGEGIVGHVSSEDAHPGGGINRVARVDASSGEAVVEIIAAAGADIAQPQVSGIGVEADAPGVGQPGGPGAETSPAAKGCNDRGGLG